MVTLFEHFSAAKSLYSRYTAPVCKAFGLTQMEYNILMFLYNNPQLSTAADIVKFRNLTKSHVSVSVKSLQEKGLIRGEYLPGNRRDVHLRLCPQAQPIVESGRQAQEHFGRRLMQGFSPEEEAQLMDYMTRIHNNLKTGE